MKPAKLYIDQVFQNQTNIGSYNTSDNYYNKLAEDLMVYLINYSNDLNEGYLREDSNNT